MSRLLFRAGVRYHLRHRWQLALALLGIALGVAVVVAVDVATGSARRAFTLSTEAVSGRATHEIVGGPTGLPEILYTRLRVELGVDSIAPIVDRHVEVAGRDAEDTSTGEDASAARGTRVLRVLGVDPFAEAPFRGGLAGAADGGVPALLSGPGVLLTPGTAAALDAGPGDTLTVTRPHDGLLVLAGLLSHGDVADGALEDVALADIATAQEIAGARGVLDRIEVRVSRDAAGERELARIRAALPPGARLLETGTRAGATARLTRAFELNLTALALVALVFGMFLIYNSVTFSMVQRRPLFGLLRAQGVTARELFALLLGEAAVLGLAATAVGIGAGLLLGTQLLGLVARTVNDLYFTVPTTGLHVTPGMLVKATLLGIGGTVAAAVPPAREALLAAPRITLARASLERGTRRAAGRLAAAGAATGLASVALLAVPSTSVTPGFAALFILILAAALLTPAVTVVSMAAAQAVLARAGPIARMSARGVVATLSRTAPAIAALGVAVAVGAAMTLLIGSFRASVVQWLSRSLPADIYLSAPGLGANRTDVALDPDLPEQVAGVRDVAGVSTYRHVPLLLGDDLVGLIAVDLFPPHRSAFDLLEGEPAEAWESFGKGGALISEPLAFRRGLAPGDTLTLPTDRGPARVPIAAVYRDYASEHGVIFLDRAAYDALWDDDAATSLAVFLRSDADAAAALAAIRALPAAGGVLARSNRTLRASTLRVFDRTFVITGVLRLLALIVAFVGVTGALLALQLERTREIATLRALGFTPAQVRTLIMSRTALMGVAAAALALPLALVMGWVMVHVINRRSFGWSSELVFTAAPFVQAVAVAVGAALLAGLYPAWRMAARPPAEGLRSE